MNRAFPTSKRVVLPQVMGRAAFEGHSEIPPEIFPSPPPPIKLHLFLFLPKLISHSLRDAA